MIDKEAAKTAARNACKTLLLSFRRDPIEDTIERLSIYSSMIIDEMNTLIRIENERRASSQKDYEEIPFRKYPSAVIGAKVRGIIVDGEFHPADDHGTVTITI